MNIQAYKYQLEQVNASLLKDPENESFKLLAKKLETFIKLYTETDRDRNQVPVSKPKHYRFNCGDFCEAKNLQTSQWEHAKIQSRLDDEDSCIVLFSSGLAQNSGPPLVRVPVKRELEPKPVTTAKSDAHRVKNPAKPVNPRKRESDRHGDKQKAEWQSFSSKISKTTGGIFKRELHKK